MIIFLPLSYVVGEFVSSLVPELLFGLASAMTCDLAFPWGSLDCGQDLLLSPPLLCSQSSDPVGLCPAAWGARGSGVTLGSLLALPASSRPLGLLLDAVQLTTLPFSWSRSFHAVACLLYDRDVAQFCSTFFTGNIKAEYLAEGLVISRGYSKEFRILDFCYS